MSPVGEERATTPGHDFIDGDRSFGRLIDRLVDAPRYALDTEFHRERTYFPQVAVVQIADEHGTVVIDALNVDLAPLARVLNGPGVAVLHAARQDLEVLERVCGTVPSSLFDTQIAAGFVGYTTPSLSTLLERELGVQAPKADRLTDWLQRPLTPAQLDYAASDVAHLLELHDRLHQELERRGRLPWVEEACQSMRVESRGPRNPEEAWRRIKEIRHLQGSALAVAQAVAAWRETRAAEADLTPRFVLSDLAVVSIASSAPSTDEELRSLRGVDGRAMRNGAAETLLGVVASARQQAPARSEPRSTPELPAELRPALPLIAAWVSQRSRDLDLETALLATRSDIEDLLRGAPEARLATGWRAELVGGPIRRLLSGEAALAFERGEGLVLRDVE